MTFENLTLPIDVSSNRTVQIHCGSNMKDMYITGIDGIRPLKAGGKLLIIGNHGFRSKQ